ncbi:MAG: hypothetical protein RIL09_11405 [Alphaproteobacteria bacterium]
MAPGTLTLAPLLPWPVLVALAVMAGALLALAMMRRARGAGWRLLAMAGLLAALLNPAWVQEERTALPDVALVVVDDSASQGIGQRRARSERALAALQAQAVDDTTLELRVVWVGGRAEEHARDDGTRLFDAVAESLADVAPTRRAGIVLLSDGQVHDAPQSAAQAERLGAPVHVLLSGERDENDRRLVVVEAPGYGLVDRPVTVVVRVEDDTVPDGTPVRLTLRQDDRLLPALLTETGRDRAIEITPDHAGATIVELAVDGRDGQLTARNDQAVFVINGVRDRLRVLLVSGQPHPGERTWRSLLKADPSVDLVHFTILRPPEKEANTPVEELSLIAFPTRELFQDRLDEFDLIIFDRYRRRGVLPSTYIENVARYVRDGGAVLVATDESFATPLSLYRTPLDSILPVTPTGDVLEGGFRATLSAVGRRHPVTAGLEGAGTVESGPLWGRWFRQVSVRVRDGETLMTGAEEAPLLVVSRQGNGRVALLNSDHFWLWSRGFEGGGPASELLRRMAHWLMKEPALEEEDLRATADGNRLTVERRSLSPDPARVRLTSPAGAVTDLRLEPGEDGRATTELAVVETGVFRVEDGTRSTLVAVGALNPLEFQDARTTPEPLATVMNASGGGALWLAETAEPAIRRVGRGRTAAGGTWLGLVANRDFVVTGLTRVPLAPPWLVLALIMGGIVFAWRRESA